MLGRLKRALRPLAALFSPFRGPEISNLEEMLVAADVGAVLAGTLSGRIKNERAPVDALKKELLKIVDLPRPRVDPTPPLVVMVSGVNGSGKTTSLAKLADIYRRQGSVLLASADTYRDAASEQLEIWAKRTGVDIVTSRKGQDAAAVVYDSLARAIAKKIATVMIDTAGRLHTRSDLMAELKKIKRITEKFKPRGLDLNLLVVDATLGQNSLQQARIFKEELGVNGIVLAKMDGTARGGAIFPICAELMVPVVYLGIGERLEDIVEFDAREFIDILFERIEQKEQ